MIAYFVITILSMYILRCFFNCASLGSILDVGEVLDLDRVGMLFDSLYMNKEWRRKISISLVIKKKGT